MSVNENKITRFVARAEEGEIVRNLPRLSTPLERSNAAGMWQFCDYVQDMSAIGAFLGYRRIKDELTPQTPEEAMFMFNSWREKQREWKPKTEKDHVPFNIYGTRRMCDLAMGWDLNKVSIAFISGNIRFAEIIPPDMSSDLMSYASLAQADSLYTMILGSLYWQIKEQEINYDQARCTVADLTCIYKISPDTHWPHPWQSEDSWYRFLKDLNQYNQYAANNSLPQKDLVMEQLLKTLDFQQVAVPPELKRWLECRLTLLDDFEIQSSIPSLHIDLPETMKDQVVQLVPNTKNLRHELRITTR